MIINRLVKNPKQVALYCGHKTFECITYIKDSLKNKRHEINKLRAYYLWDRDGRPEGKANYYYFMAERDLEFVLNHPFRFIWKFSWKPYVGERIIAVELPTVELQRKTKKPFSRKFYEFLGFPETVDSFYQNFELSVFAFVFILCLAMIVIDSEQYEVNKPFLSISKILILRVEAIAILTAIFVYLIGHQKRKKQSQNEAWITINSAQGKSGNGGRVDALTSLNQDYTNLSGLSAPFSDLTGIKLNYSIVKRADLKEAFLDSSQMKHSDMEFSDLSRAKIRNADFSYSNLNGSRLDYADFSNSNLLCCSLRGAYLENTILCKADLRGADLRYCDLRGADLRYCDLRGAQFDGALYNIDLDLIRLLFNSVIIFLYLTPAGFWLRFSLFPLFFLLLFIAGYLFGSFELSTSIAIFWIVLLYLVTLMPSSIVIFGSLNSVYELWSDIYKFWNRKTFFPDQFLAKEMGMESFNGNEMLISWEYRRRTG